jgi:hypothetical protein
MLAYKHSGFSVNTSVRIEAHDRAGLERLLRYCARPAFSMERLRKAGKDLVYRYAKQHSEPGGDWRTDPRGVNNRGVKAGELTLTPLELINRIAALIPPPRTHRHRSTVRDTLTPQGRGGVVSTNSLTKFGIANTARCIAPL